MSSSESYNHLGHDHIPNEEAEWNTSGRIVAAIFGYSALVIGILLVLVFVGIGIFMAIRRLKKRKMRSPTVEEDYSGEL